MLAAARPDKCLWILRLLLVWRVAARLNNQTINDRGGNTAARGTLRAGKLGAAAKRTPEIADKPAPQSQARGPGDAGADNVVELKKALA